MSLTLLPRHPSQNILIHKPSLKRKKDFIVTWVNQPFIKKYHALVAHNNIPLRVLLTVGHFPVMKD